MAIFNLAWKSLYNRKTTVFLTICAVAISVCLLLGVERIKTQAKESFSNTISGTDLIVGARTGPVQLLLYSVFRIGNATNNISWESYQALQQHKAVKWSVPLSLGDSHRGFRVLGTNQDYFKYYQHNKSQHLQLQKGTIFSTLFDAVIGADVADKLNYKVGDKIILAHGAGSVSFIKHDNMPFTITGILSRTSTPVDQTVHVSLDAIEAIHSGWETGASSSNSAFLAKTIEQTFQPTQITAALIGLRSTVQMFQLQRFINEYEEEPLLAIIPGVALHELWSLMSIAEQALMVVSGFVVASGLLGMLTMILTSLNERRREMAILRAIGARPRQIFLLMISEAGIIALFGAVLGVIVLYGLMLAIEPIAQNHYGVSLNISTLTAYEWKLLGVVCLSGLTIGVIPSMRAYLMSLADGMTIRV